MTKEEYLKNFIDRRIKIMHELHCENAKLCESYGVEITFDKKKDLEELKVKYEKEAELISSKVDWSMLNKNKKKFDKIFIDEMLKCSL